MKRRSLVGLVTIAIFLSAGTVLAADPPKSTPTESQAGGNKPKRPTQAPNALTPAEDLLPAKPFKLLVDVALGDEAAGCEVYFVEDAAVLLNNEKPQGVLVYFDLKNPAWISPSTKQLVSLADCEAWAIASTKKSRESLKKIEDQKLKALVTLTLNPKFKTKLDGKTVIMSNDLLEYRMVSELELPEGQMQRFFAYDRINAYHKAMTDRKLPPFAQLIVTKELESRKFVPSRIDMTVKSRDRDVKFVSTIKVEDLSSGDVQLINEAIKRSKIK